MQLLMTAQVISNIPGLIANSQAGVSVANAKAAAEIEREAKRRSRYETGNMRGGWQTDILGPYERMVYNLVEYTVYNEFGTIYMSAQPMLGPAIELAEQTYPGEIAAVYAGHDISTIGRPLTSIYDRHTKTGWGSIV